MYFTSEYADVQYLKDKDKVLLTWKKKAKFDNYRNPTTAALELLKEHNCDFVIDARNGFEDEKEMLNGDSLSCFLRCQRQDARLFGSL